MTDWPARAVGERRSTFLFVTIEDLIAGLPRNAEFPAQIAHTLFLDQAGDEPQALLHSRTLPPRHQHLPFQSRECDPCVRNDLSPMSRVGQRQVEAAAMTANRACQHTLEDSNT